MANTGAACRAPTGVASLVRWAPVVLRGGQCGSRNGRNRTGGLHVHQDRAIVPANVVCCANPAKQTGRISGADAMSASVRALSPDARRGGAPPVEIARLLGRAGRRLRRDRALNGAVLGL